MRDNPSLKRRADTRSKIELGGLVAKAGLREADRAFLLGGFLSLAKIPKGTDLYERMQAEGRAAFLSPPPEKIS